MAEYLITHDQDPVFINFISEKLGVNFRQENSHTVSHIRKNDDGTYTLLAVSLFDHFSEHHIEVSIASSSYKWATWNYIHAVYEFAFKDGRSRLNMIVEPRNTNAVTMHEKLGHKREGYLRDWFGEDNDAIVFGLTRRDYLESKWFKRSASNK